MDVQENNWETPYVMLMGPDFCLAPLHVAPGLFGMREHSADLRFSAIRLREDLKGNQAGPPLVVSVYAEDPVPLLTSLADLSGVGKLRGSGHVPFGKKSTHFRRGLARQSRRLCLP